jgi:hypothetical protein
MIMREVSVGGAVAYWKSTWTSRPHLVQHFQDLGLEEKMIPEQREPLTVLRHCLQHHIGANKGTMIRPLKNRNGYEAVIEKRGLVSNEYQHWFTAVVSDGGIVNVLDDGYDDTSSNLHTLYQHFKDLLSGEAVSAALKRLVLDLAGTTLRDAGGVYWLPDDKVELWERFAQAYEKSGDNQIYRLRVQADEHMIRAVRDAIESELSEKVEEIKTDVQSNTLGVRALQGRVEAAKGLRDKLKTYEQSLGVTLSEVGQAIENAESTAAHAVILASAKKASDQAAKASGVQSL